MSNAAMGPVSTLTPYTEPRMTVFDFNKVAVDDPRFTFVGGAGRTYIDSLRRLRTATVNEMRLETGADGKRYLLLEPTSTNEVLQSGNPAAWSASLARMVPSENTFAGYKMAKLVADTSVGPHYVDRTISLQPEGSVWSYQCVMRAAEQKFVRVSVYAGGSGAGAFFNTNVNLLTGELSSTTADIFFTIERLADDVFLLKVQGLVTLGTGIAHRIRFTTLNAAGTSSSVNGNDADGVWVGGPQIEAGAACTAYIETSVSAVTSPAEQLTMLDPFVASMFSAAEGTILIDAAGNPGVSGGNITIISNRDTLGGGTVANIVALRYTASVRAASNQIITPTTSRTWTSANGTYASLKRVLNGIAWAADNYRSAVNGTIRPTTGNYGTLTLPNRLNIGGTLGVCEAQLRLHRLQLGTRGMTEAELIQATRL